jgi:hypothetical protein
MDGTSTGEIGVLGSDGILNARDMLSEVVHRHLEPLLIEGADSFYGRIKRFASDETIGYVAARGRVHDQPTRP